MIDLPAGRTGRVVETISAGQFRIQVIGADWIARLAGAGALDRQQVETAQLLAVLWEQTGLRPRVVAGCYAGKVDTCNVGHHALEDLDAKELKAWRRWSKALAAVPAHCRPVVEDICCWDRFAAGSIPRLRVGLDAAARMLGIGRR